MILKERLHNKRVLLVLDNVNKLEQLYALCGRREWFGVGSIIIITTRDKHLLRVLRVDHVYRVPELDQSESLELFSWHAFNQACPKEDFVELSGEVVAYSGGLPFALVVLGSILSAKVTLEWENMLQELKKIPNPEVQKVLKLSFDDLNDEEKNIFLDIACFFIGMGQNHVIRTLNRSTHSPEHGISVLVDKSLVNIDEHNKIGMHVLLRDMGREIIREESQIKSKVKSRIYDVFLSFRGEDTRSSFTSHLYASLQNAGIYAFKDDNNITRGHQISVSLLQAIRKSKICIIVLSRKYPNSRWCMQELENIMEGHRTMGLMVVPVFYEVDPSEICNLKGEIGKDFEGLVERISVDVCKVRNWKTALLEVGGIAGFVVKDSRDESADIKTIVEHVTRLLDRTELFVAKYPVGVESRVKEAVELLDKQQSSDVFHLGIWGMGGIGKTTIAKAIYNQIGRKFEGRSFLQNIRGVWQEGTSKVSLQQQLLNDIYKATPIKIPNNDSGENILKNRLSQIKVLLVLDDVDERSQLKALCGDKEWFSPGSTIIITTRNKDLLKDRDNLVVYSPIKMNDKESLEYFCWHAFKQASPPTEDFLKCSESVVAYSGGLPLALKVIGSYLIDKTIEEWENVLNELGAISQDEVQKQLKISFDGLTLEQQEIFLDIACFFIGKNRDDVIQILHGYYRYPYTGTNALIERSLVIVDDKRKIQMHDLLRDMGRDIIYDQSPSEPEKRSRLWHSEDAFDVLFNEKGTKKIKGLAYLESENKNSLEIVAFDKMKSLKLLQLAGVKPHGDLNYLSNDLRWLCWRAFSSTGTTGEFFKKRLVAIELKYSTLEQMWTEAKMLKKLKILNLSHSPNLTETPDFSCLLNLEKLVLKDCPNLSKVSDTIGCLKQLKLTNLKNCRSLPNLPERFYNLSSLETLILMGCSKIDKLEEGLEHMKNLTKLIVDKTTKVPFSIVRSKSIEYISICGFEGLSHYVFPSLIRSWLSLTNNPISLVQTSLCTSSPISLDTPCSSSYSQSSNFKNLSRLRCLYVECDFEHQLAHDVERILEMLKATNDKKLEASATTSQIFDMDMSPLIDSHSQVKISGSKNFLEFLSIQMETECQLPSIPSDNILQTTDGLRDSFWLPNDYDWLSFTCEGSSLIFEVPPINGNNLKRMMLWIVYSSSPDRELSKGCQSVLIINHRKPVIWFCKIDTLTSFEDEEWQSIRSDLEPGDKVEVIVDSSDGFNVKKTILYLFYDKPIEEEMEGDYAVNKDVIDPSRDKSRFGGHLTLPSLVQKVLISRPIWFGLAGILVLISCRHSNRRRSRRQDQQTFELQVSESCNPTQ